MQLLLFTQEFHQSKIFFYPISRGLFKSYLCVRILNCIKVWHNRDQKIFKNTFSPLIVMHLRLLMLAVYKFIDRQFMNCAKYLVNSRREIYICAQSFWDKICELADSVTCISCFLANLLSLHYLCIGMR